MQVLALVGSYRKQGNTARIVGLIAEHLQEQAARHAEKLEVETLYLAHQDVAPCRGCRVCFDQGEDRCPLKDDLLAIKARMEEADALIIASPVYVNDVNGVVKNWIDRLAYVCHRPEFADKCAYLVTTVASSPTHHALRTLKLALSGWGYHVVGQAGFKMGALMDPDPVRVRYQPQAAAIAQKLFRAIRTRGFTRPSFLSLMTFKIKQRYWQRIREESVDHAYWVGRGWTEPRREFFVQTETSPVKVAFARLAGALIARFVT